MKRFRLMAIAFLFLLVMQGISWWIYRQSSSTQEGSAISLETEERTNIDTSPGVRSIESPLASSLEETPIEGFPSPSIEEKNGRIERTIHMGVRQYVWEPSSIVAKRGELVRLIIHNADVKHGIAIPVLGVNADVPMDGAVVEFVAEKAGIFEFFCSVWCGEGHMEMTGKIIIEE